MIPDWIEAFPRVGPTTFSCSMTMLVSILPELSTLARSVASSMVKFPEIEEFPPVISPLTFGAEYTTPSRTMAIERLVFSFVRRAQICEPSWFMDIET